MERNPYDSPQAEPARRPSRSAWHMRATLVIVVLVLLAIVISLVIFT